MDFRRVLPRVALITLTLGTASLIAPAARSQGVSIETATDAQKKEAQAQYERGAKAFDAKQYEDALAAFSSSYSIVRSPNAHMMMARALMQLGRCPRAYNELVVVEQEAAGLAKYAQTLDRAKELRAECAPKVALVTVFVKGEPGIVPTITVGEIAAKPETAVAVDPGKIRVVVKAAGYQNQKEISVLAGQSELVELRVGPDPNPLASATVAPATSAQGPTTAPTAGPGAGPGSAPSQQQASERHPAATGVLASGIVVGLLGLGTMAVGSGFYFAAQDDHDYLLDPENGCVPNADETRYACPAGVAQRIQDGQDNQDVATVVFGVGSGVAGLGLVLAITGGVLAGPPVNDDKIAVRVGPGSASLSVAF